jgi:hypothetical protein
MKSLLLGDSMNGFRKLGLMPNSLMLIQAGLWAFVATWIRP